MCKSISNCHWLIIGKVHKKWIKEIIDTISALYNNME